MKKRILNLFSVFLFAAASLYLFTPEASGEESKKLTLTVGAYQNSPKIYKDSEGNTAGFYRDLLDYISNKEGWEINYLWGSWEESIQRLTENRLDIMPDVAISQAREKLYVFNEESVLSNWARLYAAQWERADSFLDLKDKKIAVMGGSIHTDGESGIKNLLKGFDISCSFIEVTNYKEVFELLDKKEADFGIVNRTFGNANEKKFRVRRTSVMFNPADLRFAFPPGAQLNSRLIKSIDYHMGKLKDNSDSIYYTLLDKHFGIAIEKPPLPLWVMDMIYALIALLLAAVAGIVMCRRTVRQKTKELNKAHLEVIDRLGNALEYRDTCTGRHINMVSEIAYHIAKEIGLSREKCDLLRKAATMHDVGKIAIGDNILLKPDKLTTDEFNIIKEHTTLGADMLSEGKSELIKMAETIAMYHHERWDGQGYPCGLREKQIPLVARICKVADVFDALISERPYKKPWPIKDALNEIIIRKGTHFDPKIVSVFIKILPGLIKKFNLKETPAEFDKNGKWGRSK